MNEDLDSLFGSEQFRALLTEAVSQKLAEFVKRQEQRAREISLLERLVRVEESLLSQTRVLEALQREMNVRFEAMDKRFEALQREMGTRFEAMDKRFEIIDKRFEAMDKRFEALVRRIDRFMFWSFGITLTVGSLIVAAIKLLP